MLKKLLLTASVLVLTACSGGEVLLRDLAERDANEIVAVLYTNQIHSEKSADAKGKSFTVMVKKGQLPAAVAVLQANGLPRQNRVSLNDVFKSNGFAPTAFEERVRFTYGISQELERTISYMEGVLNARVHVVIPEKAYRRENQAKPSASVFITYDDKVPFEENVPKIRKLVSESIENLEQESVDVLVSPVKVDLSKVVKTPVTRVAGISVAGESTLPLAILLLTVIACLCTVVFMSRSKLIPLVLPLVAQLNGLVDNLVKKNIKK